MTTWDLVSFQSESFNVWNDAGQTVIRPVEPAVHTWTIRVYKGDDRMEVEVIQNFFREGEWETTVRMVNTARKLARLYMEEKK
jgi:hypothetical protein